MSYVLTKDWSEVLSTRFTQEYKKELFSWLDNEYANKTIFPTKTRANTVSQQSVLLSAYWRCTFYPRQSVGFDYNL